MERTLLAPKHIRTDSLLPWGARTVLKKNVSHWDQMIYFARLKGLSSLMGQKARSIIGWTSWKISNLETKKDCERPFRKGMAQKSPNLFLRWFINPPLLIWWAPVSRIWSSKCGTSKMRFWPTEGKRNHSDPFQLHRMESWSFFCESSRRMIKPIKKILDGTIKQCQISFRPEVYSIYDWIT